ncbi:MAG: hypothetical protein U0165_17705 [Polyangiaceae bacterium]
MAFALQLIDVPGVDVSGSLLGLSVPLRLALTAQASGASAVVVDSDRLMSLLDDPRLTIPRVKARPSGVFLVTAKATLVVHRGYINELRKVRGDQDSDIEGDAVPFDVPFGFSMMHVTDKASKAVARKALMRALRKPQDGWTSTALNRPISLFFTRFLVETPFHPNQVSIVILAIGLVGSWLASRGDYTSMALGGLLFHVQSVLDGCDGEMSRLTFRGSKTGEWLDTVGDDITNYSFFGAAGWGLYVNTQNPMYLAAGGLCLGLGVITSAIEYRYLIKIGSGDLAKYPIGVGNVAGNEGPKTFIDKISPLFKRDTFVFLTFVSAALGLLSVMLMICAVGAIIIFVAVLKAELRMFNERRAAAR